MVLILSMAIVSSSLVIAIEKRGIYGKPVPHWLNRLLLRNKSIKTRFQQVRRSFVSKKLLREALARLTRI